MRIIARRRVPIRGTLAVLRQRYTVLYEAKVRAAPPLASPWHNWARFGETGCLSYLCISRKRKSPGFSSFRVFRGQLSYMSGKIISKLVKICSFIIFTKCFIVKNSLSFEDFLTGQISLFLIIPKSSRRIVFTLSNAPFTLCAESQTALTGFIFLESLKFWKGAAARQIYAAYL